MIRHFILAATLLLFGLPSLKAQEKEGKKLFGDCYVRHLGPAIMGGRVSTIDAVNGHKTIYVGAAGGGIWKSTNAGASFRPIFDKYCQSIGKITIDQNHSDTVWVGTGESWTRNSTSVGDGIYKTRDGGNNWQHLGLKETERIADIVIHKDSSDVVYVAALGKLWKDNEERGVFKTTDGGKTWKKVLYVNQRTGCADLAIDPSDPNVIYAAMWEFRREPDFFTSGGPGSGLYRSEDGGETWKKIQKGLPKGELGRMAIEFSPVNPERVYLSMECEKKIDKGIYRSDTGGEDWKKVNDSFNAKVRPFYFANIIADPLDSNKLYKCGYNLIVSESGGDNFKEIGGGVHPDVHDVWVDPKDPDFVLIATDGGVYRSLNGGDHFEGLHKMPIAQFYNISIDNQKPYNVYGGLQDNGSWRAPSETFSSVSNKDWKLLYFGDGFHVVPHPTDKDIIYCESQGGNVVRYNAQNGLSKMIAPIALGKEAKYRFNWNTPIDISKHNPEKLFLGSQYLLVSHDRGESWKKISPDLTTNDPKRQRQRKSGGLSIDNSTAENNTTIYTFQESPLDSNVIWVGTDDGYLQVTTDGGKKWTNVTSNIPGLPQGTWCSFVEPGRFDRQTVYVTFDGHRSGDMNSYLFVSKDMGASWERLKTEGIKSHLHCIRQDLKVDSLLFLGAEDGLYASLNQGADWYPFTRVPKVSVRDIEIHPEEHDLVLGTHGRGILIINELPLIRQLSGELINTDFQFVQTEPGGSREFVEDIAYEGAGRFTADRIDKSLSLAYYQKKRHIFGKMFIEIFDQQGNLVRTTNGGKRAGLNIVRIPTRYPLPKSAPTRNRMALGGGFLTPRLASGEYKVVVHKGKKEYTTSIFLEEDVSVFSREDRAVQREAHIKLYDMANEIGYLYYESLSLQRQIEKLAKEEKKSKKKKYLKVAKELSIYREKLASQDGDFYVDSGEELIREEVGVLYYHVGNYAGRPTHSQLTKITELESRLTELRLQWTMMLAKAAKSAGPDSLKVKSLEDYVDQL